MRARNVQVIVRLSSEEKEYLTRQVKRSGLSQAAYLRLLIRGYVPREPPPADYYGMTRELRAIGNRMNQIAARANATGFFLAGEYTQNVCALNEALLKIQAAMTQPERMP